MQRVFLFEKLDLCDKWGSFKIISHCDDLQIAESIVQNLRQLGFKAFSIEDAELHQPVEYFPTRTMEIVESEIIFGDDSPHVKRIINDNIFLIIEGIIQDTIETATTTKRRKLNVPLTLLMGGIPISRKVKESTTTQSVQSELFVRLYEREPGNSVVEMLQNSMNYSFLEDELAMASNINFSKTVSNLKEICSQAIFDNRLMKPAAAISYTGQAREDLEINCKLISLFHHMNSRKL